MNDPINILLIEDNAADARLIQEALLETARDRPSAGRFKLTVADRLSDGLQLLTQGNVDVILLDLSLPDSHGLSTLHAISTEVHAVPVVVMTGLDDETITAGALQAGAQDFLIKGELDSSLLMRAIRYAIERKRAEEALRESEKQLRALNETLEQKVKEKTAEVHRLASELTRAEQRERHRISHILHDDLQQRLYAIQMQMTFLRGGLEIEDAAVQRDLAEITEQLDEVLAVTRNLSVNLSPPILQDEGLTQAISWLASQMQQQHGLRIELQAGESFAIPDKEIQVLVFNCVRELLFNIVKHAGINQAVVSLQRSNADLRIDVRDQGRGFSTTVPAWQDGHKVDGDAPRQQSFGLPTLRHRLTLFGGRMDIRSEPGAGTQITLTIPVYRDELRTEEIKEI